MKIKNFLIKYFTEIIIILSGLFFSTYIMTSTFSSDSKNLYISTKAWSDFSSHIPLIRSFSLGLNFPVEYPLFPGEPINYHFLFYATVGLLEKIGIPIGIALNLPSILGLTLLIIIIYLFAKLIFRSKTVGILSVIFFLFNSSLSFIYFFQKYPLSTKSFSQIISNSDFLSFAPYGDGLISAFWNLNIYTNQRHLGLSFGLSLLLIYFLIKPVFENRKENLKLAVILGLILGSSFFLHLAVFFMSAIVIFVFAIFFSKIRKSSIILLFSAAVIALPQYLYISSNQGYSPILNFGYLVANNLTFATFTQFWIFNLGISIILMIVGFIFANKNQRKILIAFFSLFLIGNIVQFSVEIAANHKFFNYFLLVGNMFSAYALLLMWNKKNVLKPVVIVLFLLMIFGGIIDFFPIHNDTKAAIPDYKINPTSKWILNYTKPDSVILNTTFIYNPASLAGRKIFIGWPYFAWSQGYDTNARGEVFKNILGSNNKNTACLLLLENDIDYIEINNQSEEDPNIPPISSIYREDFQYSYSDSSGLKIYDVQKNCK